MSQQRYFPQKTSSVGVRRFGPPPRATLREDPNFAFVMRFWKGRFSKYEISRFVTESIGFLLRFF